MWSQQGNLSVIIGALLPLLLSQVSMTLTGDSTFTFTPEHAKELLEQHNEYRRQESAANMYEMHWNISLQQRADAWIENCEFKHENCFDAGENLFFTTAVGDEAFARGMKAWHDEKSLWSYSSGNCMASCHYTQIVWAWTTTVGCSAKVCATLKTPSRVFKDALIFACYYYPRGNFIGHYPFSKGPTCSGCAEGDTCSEEMCVSSGPDSKSAPEVVKMLTPRTPVRLNLPITKLKRFQSLVQSYISQSRKVPQSYTSSQGVEQNGQHHHHHHKHHSQRSRGNNRRSKIGLRDNKWSSTTQSRADNGPVQSRKAKHDKTVGHHTPRGSHTDRHRHDGRGHHRKRHGQGQVSQRENRWRHQMKKEHLEEREKGEVQEKEGEMEEKWIQKERALQTEREEEIRRLRQKELEGQRELEEVLRQKELERQRELEEVLRQKELERQRELEEVLRQKELERQREIEERLQNELKRQKEKKKMLWQKELERQKEEVEKRKREKEVEIPRKREEEMKQQRQKYIKRQKEEEKLRLQQVELKRKLELERINKEREGDMQEQKEIEAQRLREEEREKQKEMEERERKREEEIQKHKNAEELRLQQEEKKQRKELEEIQKLKVEEMKRRKEELFQKLRQVVLQANFKIKDYKPQMQKEQIERQKEKGEGEFQRKEEKHGRNTKETGGIEKEKEQDQYEEKIKEEREKVDVQQIVQQAIHGQIRTETQNKDEREILGHRDDETHRQSDEVHEQKERETQGQSEGEIHGEMDAIHEQTDEIQEQMEKGQQGHVEGKMQKQIEEVQRQPERLQRQTEKEKQGQGKVGIPEHTGEKSKTHSGVPRVGEAQGKRKEKTTGQYEKEALGKSEEDTQRQSEVDTLGHSEEDLTRRREVEVQESRQNQHRKYGITKERDISRGDDKHLRLKHKRRREENHTVKLPHERSDSEKEARTAHHRLESTMANQHGAKTVREIPTKTNRRRGRFDQGSHRHYRAHRIHHKRAGRRGEPGVSSRTDPSSSSSSRRVSLKNIAPQNIRAPRKINKRYKNEMSHAGQVLSRQTVETTRSPSIDTIVRVVSRAQIEELEKRYKGRARRPIIIKVDRSESESQIALSRPKATQGHSKIKPSKASRKPGKSVMPTKKSISGIGTTLSPTAVSILTSNFETSKDSGKHTNLERKSGGYNNLGSGSEPTNLKVSERLRLEAEAQEKRTPGESSGRVKSRKEKAKWTDSRKSSERKKKTGSKKNQTKSSPSRKILPHRKKFVIGPDGRKCRDRNPLCVQLAKECRRNYRVKIICPLTCGKCSHRANKTGQSQARVSSYHPNSSVSPSSYHGYSSSSGQGRGKDSRGETHQRYRSDHSESKYSPDQSQPLTLKTRPKNEEPAEVECKDKHSHRRACRRWAELGFCRKNLAVRFIYCLQSCGQCSQ